MTRYPLGEGCLIFLLLLFLTMKLLPEESFEEFSGRPVKAVGRVSQIETKKQQSLIYLKQVTVCTCSSQNKEKKIKKLSGIICSPASGESMPCSGEKVLIEGIGKTFEGARNPGCFEESGYYTSIGIDMEIGKARIQRILSEKNRYCDFLYQLRQHCGNTFDKICSEKDSAVIRAVLLGDKTEQLKEQKTLYRQSGIAHILAISGLHISFLGMGLYRLLRKLLSCIPAAIIAAGVIVSYTIMSGLSPSACRASIMFGFMLTGQILGRTCHRLTALAFAAAMLSGRQPGVLQHTGFLLSFGAILGLETLYPVLKDLSNRKIYTLMAGGLSVSIMTFPILLSSYYEFPVYSFFLNIFVIPLMSVVMVSGLAGLFAGSFSVWIGKLAFYPAHMIFVLYEKSCLYTGKMPYSRWIVGKPEGYRIYMYYIIILIVLCMGKEVPKFTAFLYLVSAVYILTSMVNVGTKVSMLDVGQGDGIVIRYEQKVILIDGGSSSEKKLAEYTLLPYLKSQGISEINYVFLTHMDEDHINGIRDLLVGKPEPTVRIRHLILPSLANPDSVYREVVQEAKGHKVPILYMKQGDCLRIKKLSLYCLHPDTNQIFEDKNQGSMVLYLTMKNFSALFMGDLEGQAEENLSELLAKAASAIKRPVTVLKAGHHGAGTASGEALLDFVKPEIALISCGKNNKYGHPHAKTIERLKARQCRIYITAKSGAVTVSTNGKNVRIRLQSKMIKNN